jgi:D-tyrosyl-tRNA(Tyr) deacylase
MARIVAQRVTSATVTVDEQVIAQIQRGLLLLVGIREGDDEGAVERLADKVGVMRVFGDDDGKMNLSTVDVAGSMLAVSQFTLYADLKKGRRPSFVRAAEPETGRRLYDHFISRLEGQGYVVKRGSFGARMLVSLQNDGPVTIVLDSDEL